MCTQERVHCTVARCWENYKKKKTYDLGNFAAVSPTLGPNAHAFLNSSVKRHVNFPQPSLHLPSHVVIFPLSQYKNFRSVSVDPYSHSSPYIHNSTPLRPFTIHTKHHRQTSFSLFARLSFKSSLHSCSEGDRTWGTTFRARSSRRLP